MFGEDPHLRTVESGHVFRTAFSITVYLYDRLMIDSQEAGSQLFLMLYHLLMMKVYTKLILVIP